MCLLIFSLKVDKLAAVRRIQFRTGCFCNTGACQVSLGLTRDQIMAQIKVQSMWEFIQWHLYMAQPHMCYYCRIISSHVNVLNGN